MLKVRATQSRNQLEPLLRRVRFGHERVIVKRHGGPVAALIPIADLRFFEAIEDRLDIETIKQALADPDQKWYTLEEAEELLGLDADDPADDTG
jgi:prevent-host-death family protein